MKVASQQQEPTVSSEFGLWYMCRIRQNKAEASTFRGLKISSIHRRRELKPAAQERWDGGSVPQFGSVQTSADTVLLALVLKLLTYHKFRTLD